VTEGLTVQEVLIANLNTNVLVELVEFLDRDLHVLMVPLRVLATIDTNLRFPRLLPTNGHMNDWVLLVEWATTINVEVCR
jgi:hypothetical protein